MNMTSY